MVELRMFQKFRKKPVVVEAFQWRPDVVGGWPKGVIGNNGDGTYAVHGKQGFVRVDPGDWIIKEPDGCGYYPCKPDVFAEFYELEE